MRWGNARDRTRAGEAASYYSTATAHPHNINRHCRPLPWARGRLLGAARENGAWLYHTMPQGGAFFAMCQKAGSQLFLLVVRQHFRTVGAAVHRC